VNENLSTGAVIRANRAGVHKLLANYQTGFGYKFRPMSGWNRRIGSRRRPSFMNSLKTPLKRDDQSTTWINSSCQTKHA